MKIKFLFFAYLFLFTSKSFSQKKTREFEILSAEVKIPNSFYNKISFIDSRDDSSNLGIVQVGLSNKLARVIPKIPFTKQIENALLSLIENNAKNGELLFQLRQLSFAEITKMFTEEGYCYLKAELYSKSGNDYFKLAKLDTVIIVNSLDVTRRIFKEGSLNILNFIGSNLTSETNSTKAWSLNSIIKIDSVEKEEIPIYKTNIFPEGVYTDYYSFKNLMPDYQATVEIKKDGSISSVKKNNEEGKLTKVKDFYAIVYKGQPFICTDYGFYPIEKKENDFYFVGKAVITANARAVATASFYFGIIGGLIASDAKAFYEIKIDHQSGGFIRIKEVKK